jgi:crossover junction endodeoxyribonuclease RuvC
MRVIGIDPGYDRLGVAVVENVDGKETLLTSTCIVTSAKLAFSERLLAAITKLETIIKKEKPTTLAIETLFFSKNTKTAMRVAEVRGAIIYLAAKHKLKIVELNPAAIKIAITGFGQANKDQVLSMTKRLVALDNTPRLDDEIDAIAVALTTLATNLIHKDEK